MHVQPWIAVIVIAALTTLAWRHRDSSVIRDGALGQFAAQKAPVGTRSDQDGTSRAKPAVGVRKCLIDGKLVYTNEACPPGSREQALDGALTVMSFPLSTAAQPAAAAASRPTIRDLTGNPSDGAWTEKRIDSSFAR